MNNAQPAMLIAFSLETWTEKKAFEFIYKLTLYLLTSFHSVVPSIEKLCNLLTQDKVFDPMLLLADSVRVVERHQLLVDLFGVGLLCNLGFLFLK